MGMLALLFTPVARAQDELESSRPPYVTPAMVQSWQEHGTPVTFLDVRASDEFSASHVPGAINIASDQVASLAETLSRDHPLVVYCIHSTHRAPEAAKTLQRLGFQNAYVLEGGIVAWQAGGLTILASQRGRTPTILPVTNRCQKKRSES